MTIELRESASPAGRPLGERLGDPRDFVRLGALGEVLSSGSAPSDALDAVTRCLDDANETARRLAVEVLILFGTAAVPALASALAALQPAGVRVGAASALGRTGPPAEPAIGDLCRCLQADDDMLRWHASFALGKIGAAAVPALRQVLQSPDRKAVAAAVDSLEWIGPDAGAAVADIEQVRLSTEDVALKVACSMSLAKISGDFNKELPKLEEFLRSDDLTVRKICVERMGNLGEAGRNVLPSIIGRAGDPAQEVRAAAALAMARVDVEGTKVVPVLTVLLADEVPEVRANAAMAITRYGRDVASAIPQLHAMRQDVDDRCAKVARAALEPIDLGSKET